MKSALQSAATAAFALLLAACAAAPSPPRQRLLLNYEGPQATASAAQRPQLVVRSVALPDYLDRNAILYRSSSNQLQRYAGAEWAERPSKGITRWIATALAATQPGYLVQAFTTADGRVPELSLSLLLDAAETDAKGEMQLQGSYVLASTGKTIRSGRLEGSAPLSGSGAEASVLALQKALAIAVARLSAELPAP